MAKRKDLRLGGKKIKVTCIGNGCRPIFLALDFFAFFFLALSYHSSTLDTMRGPSDFFFNGKKPFQKQEPKESPTPSEDGSGHPAVYREMLGQIEKKMELQIKKIFDRMYEVKRDLEHRMKNVKKHMEATEARIEELSTQLNMLRAKQNAS